MNNISDIVFIRQLSRYFKIKTQKLSIYLLISLCIFLKQKSLEF